MRFSSETGMRSRWFPKHETIGLQYLWLALASVCLGMVFSLSLHVGTGTASGSWLGNAPVSVLHGTFMVFFVLSIAPQAGLGTFLLPLQLGAGGMAFPRQAAVGLWLTMLSLLIMTSAFAVRTQSGPKLWVAGVLLFCMAGIANGVNFAVTAVDLRGKGMSLARMPITAWAWLVNAILSLLLYSVLAAVCVLLLDAVWAPPYHGAPSSPGFSSRDLDWQRLFWFFAQAQVYVAILPCFGIVTHLLATFARRPVWKYRAIVVVLCAAGFLDFVVVGERLFASGLNPWQPLPFGWLAASLGIPAAILIFVWLRMLWQASVQLTTAMLFALGFISLFLTGGFSGIFLARHDLQGITANDPLIAGHFHLVMGIAATFAVLASLFFWFPRLFGRALDERLGKIHFWLTFIGVYVAFMLMHWMGLLEHGKTVEAFSSRSFLAFQVQIRRLMEGALLVTVLSQSVFLLNFVRTLLRRRPLETANPWGAGTLEWSGTARRADGHSGSAVTVYRGAYEFSTRARPSRPWPDFLPQHWTPEEAKALEQQS